MPEVNTFGNMGENLKPGAPLFPYLTCSQVVLPVNAASMPDVERAKDLTRDIIYAKKLGHGISYENLTTDPNFRPILSKIVNVDAAGNTPSRENEYVDVLNNQPVPVLEKDGQHNYIPYEVKTKNPGVIAQILVCPTTGEMKVLFRGTSDLATFLTDLEDDGPGAESFQEDAHNILAQVNKLASIHKIKKVTVTGHSLGGALAQQFKALYVTAKAHNAGMPGEKYRLPAETRNNLPDDIETFLYNSAGISQDTADRALLALHYVKANNPNMKVKLNNYLEDGDVVQLTGQATIFSNVSPDLATVTMMKVQNGYKGWGLPLSLGGSALGASMGSVVGPAGTVIGGIAGAIIGTGYVAKATHCNRHFTGAQANQEKLSYVIATNETPAGRALIHSKVGKKSAFLNNPVTQLVQKTLVHTGRGIKNVCVSAFSALKKLYNSDKKPTTPTTHTKEEPGVELTTMPTSSPRVAANEALSNKCNKVTARFSIGAGPTACGAMVAPGAAPILFSEKATFANEKPAVVEAPKPRKWSLWPF